jgi:hypothetical protein
MEATVRRPKGVDRNRTAALIGNVTEAGSQFTAGADQSYTEERRGRLRRGRLAWFSVCVPLWVLSVVPLARESMDGRAGTDLVLVYLAVGAISLGVAAAVRGVYVLVTKRQFVSPSVFLIAALLAITTWGVQSAGEEEVPFAGAPAGESRAV